MKGRPTDQLVFEQMFPTTRTTNPTNFQTFLSRSLIPEVRQEVQSFYGHLQTLEAKYPGLDYTHSIHRVRLSRWPWHRRLFRAFDALSLTNAEIACLTKWEGTKWAKERYEKETGSKIKDTTADEIQQGWVEPELRWAAASRARSRTAEEPSPVEVAEDEEDEDEDDVEDDEDEDNEGDVPTDDESSILQSMSTARSDIRPREGTAQSSVTRPAAADSAIPAQTDEDSEWEQWLKNAIETGELPLLAEQIARISQSPRPTPLMPDDLFPPRMLAAARAGLWHEVPEFMRVMIRQSLEVYENWTTLQRREQEEERQQAQQLMSPASSVASAPGSGPSGWDRRTVSGLRLPSARIDRATEMSATQIGRRYAAP